MTYVPDVINDRVVFEQMLDDDKGFGYNLESVGLHGVPWRAGGQSTNRGQRNGVAILGIGPAIP